MEKMKSILITERQIKAILENDGDDKKLVEILKKCTFTNIDFNDEQISNGGKDVLQMHVLVNDVEIPVEMINLYVEIKQINNESKYQIHIFLREDLQHLGIGTKLYLAFLRLYGETWSGTGTRMNNEAITSIYNKLSQNPHVSVYQWKNDNGDEIALEAIWK
jgi:hypothetical protein